RRGIDPDIIGVVAERNRAKNRKRTRVEEPERAVPARGRHKLILVRQIGKALRLLQSADTTRLSRREIDSVDRSVPELGDEDPPMLDVDGKVINAPGDALKRNPALKRKRGWVSGLLRMSRPDRRGKEREQERSCERPAYHDA